MRVKRIGSPTPTTRYVGGISSPSGYYYYIELRRPLGFDTIASGFYANDTDVYNGLVIHNWDGNLSPYFNPLGIVTQLVDDTPADTSYLSTFEQNKAYRDGNASFPIVIRLDDSATAYSDPTNPVRVTICTGTTYAASITSCPGVTQTATPIPQPTITPTKTPQPTATPTLTAARYVEVVSSFHQSIGNVVTNQQKQTFVSDDGNGSGSKIYFRYLDNSTKIWGAWQIQAISGPELNFTLASSIKSFSQSKRPSDGLNKQDVLSSDGKTIYSRFYQNNAWGAWAVGANVSSLALPDGSTSIRAFAQSISPLNGRYKQDFLIGTGTKLYSRYWDTTKNAWGAWEVETQSSTLGLGSAIRSFSQGVDPNNIPKQDVLQDDGKKAFYRKFNGSWSGWTELPISSLQIPLQ
jgi:hypothetical protein